MKGLIAVFAPLVSGFTALAAALGVARLALLGYSALLLLPISAAYLAFGDDRNTKINGKVIQTYSANVALHGMALWNPFLDDAQRYTVRSQVKGTKEWAEANHVEEARFWTERFDPKKGYWERHDPVSGSWDDTRKPGDMFTGDKAAAREHIWYPERPRTKSRQLSAKTTLPGIRPNSWD